MKRLTIALFTAGLLLTGQMVCAQDSLKVTTETVVVDSGVADLTVEEMIGSEDMADLEEMAASQGGLYQ